MEDIKIYETYFYYDYDPTENSHRCFKNEEKAREKYLQLCEINGIKPSSSFICEDGLTIGYGQIVFED